MKTQLKVLNGGAAHSPLNDEYYQNIINENFQFIEKQCFKAVRLKLGDHLSPTISLNIENEALELSNQVLDILRNDNYRVLREFKGNAQLTTYLTAIISRRAVDRIRKKLGRGREKERAAELGNIGLILFQRVIKDGYPLQDVYNELRANGNFPGTLEELETMLHKIKGKNPGSHQPGPANGNNGNPVVKNGTSINEDEYVIPDTKSDPQALLMEKQRQLEIHRAIRDIIAPLSGEERLLLRLRFPAHEDEKTAPVEQIANALGITPKAVYKRITRLLKKCRQQLDSRGIRIGELL
jgi:RNA polymerase sigma factor (sigma-70 family)